jgi:hypothetical protein
MFGRRPESWWTRELQRIQREHDAERARWDAERRELISTICQLSHAYTPGDAAEFAEHPDQPDDSWSALDAPDGIGDELHYPAAFGEE